MSPAGRRTKSSSPTWPTIWSSAIAPAVTPDVRSSMRKPWTCRRGCRIWQTNLAPVFDAEGQPVKLLGTSRDMTEYRTLQEELAQTSKLATLGTMAAGIAHEMSQPLNIIKITADDCGLMIEEGETDVRYLAQGMELIATQAARMGEIVDQMRSFSRRDSPDVVPFDPVPPVRRAITLLERHYASEGIALVSADMPDGLLVAGRPGRLEQVVINLLSNARDAIAMRREDDPAHEREDRRGGLRGPFRRAGADHRHRRRHRSSAGNGRAYLRPVLHHQGRRQRSRPGTCPSASV